MTTRPCCDPSPADWLECTGHTTLQVPSFVWQAGRAWHIANDVGPHFATIGDPRVDTAWDDHSEAQPWESH
ncbi:hypothetical protein [Rhodococcus sp. KRD162]|uniref:hypothetical protein n=1 Tax=Rhodococcus sp. KRD162 TaxID=2729725 RepID=UPI0019D06F1A|nr:hypothetical protein [Rhodococcus sp. KRD162]